MRKWSQADKDHWRKFATKFYRVSIAKDKDASIRVKMDQILVLFLPLFALYLLVGCDLFNMSCLSQISLMTSLDIFSSNSLNLKDKISKIEQNIRKCFVAHQKFWKIFHGPSVLHDSHENPPPLPLSYKLNARSLYFNIFTDFSFFKRFYWRYQLFCAELRHKRIFLRWVLGDVLP